MPVGMFCIELTEERIKEPVLGSVCFLTSVRMRSCVHACVHVCVRTCVHACVVGEASSPSVLETSSLPTSGVHHLLWSAVPFTLDSGGREPGGKALGVAGRPGCPPGRRTWPLPGFSLAPSGDTEQWRLHPPAISHPVPWTSPCAFLSCSGKTPE